MKKADHRLFDEKFKRELFLLISFAVLVIGVLSSCVGTPGESSFEVDVTAKVYKVVDGDTFDAFPIGRVRLADVNAPELDTDAGQKAKKFLTELILGEKVYLDVDDVKVMDRYNRIVAVVYVRYNSTHLLNVNKYLLEKGYAAVMDYPNEFNPSNWLLYVYYPEKLESETITETFTETKILTSTRIFTETETKLVTSTETYTLTESRTIHETVTETSFSTVTSVSTYTIEKPAGNIVEIAVLLLAAFISGVVIGYFSIKSKLRKYRRKR